MTIDANYSGKVLIRSGLVFFITCILILSWQYVYFRKFKNRSIPVSVGLVLVFILLLFRISSFGLGVALTTEAEGANYYKTALGGFFSLWL